MVAKLFAKFGPMKNKTFEIDEDMVIGRAQASQIVLTHKLVSNTHARIYRDFDRGCYMLEDLDSLNGTILDGEPINTPQRLGHLHVLNFGGSADFFFVDSTQVPARGTRATPTVLTKAPRQGEEGKDKTFMGKGFVATPNIFAKESQSQAASSPAKPKEKKSTVYGERPAIPAQLMDKLRHEAKPEGEPATSASFQLSLVLPGKKAQKYPLANGENLVGRGEGLPVRIVDSQMSRHHAIIDVRKGRVYIRDLGSTNNTYVNGKRIDREVELKAGTKLGFGKLKGVLERRNHK